MSSTAVEAQGLQHAYPSKGGPRRALDGIELAVQRGEVYGLLGPNGGGKTTLCRILTTLLRPDRGRVSVLGLDALQEPQQVRRRIGVVFQNQSLDRKLSVRENLRHQGHLYGLHGRHLEERISELLEKVGLTERESDWVEWLSGGLRRRAELAKSLLHGPELLILDEPTSGVDPGARQDFWSYVSALQEQAGLTVLLTTHLMEEAERCSRLAILDQGRIVAQGTPDELKSEIGGDVISVRSREPARLISELRSKFGVEAALVEETLRIEKLQGHAFIPALVEAFPGLISSITLSKPTLEDVFIHRTRHGFWRFDEQEELNPQEQGPSK